MNVIYDIQNNIWSIFPQLPFICNNSILCIYYQILFLFNEDKILKIVLTPFLINEKKEIQINSNWDIVNFNLIYCQNIFSLKNHKLMIQLFYIIQHLFVLY